MRVRLGPRETIQGASMKSDSRPYGQRRNPAHAAIAILLAALLVTGGIWLPLPGAEAFASPQGDDVIAGSSVSDRGLATAQAPDVACRHGILADANGNVLWSRDADSTAAMASITKVMTAILAIEDEELTPETMVNIGEDAAATGESEVGLVAGTQVSVQDLLEGLLVHSGNDCAVALADAVAGSQEAFVAQMNDKAAQIGMTQTHFATASGLDEGVDHHSTASDILVMVRYAMQYDMFRQIVSMRSCTVSNGMSEQSFESTNELFGMMAGDEGVNVEGIKTGYTSKAGNCLASAATKDGTELYCVVLGCDTEQGRFTDSKALLEWGFAHYAPLTLADAGTQVAEVPLAGWRDRTVAATVPSDVVANVLDYDGDVSATVSCDPVEGSVRQGQVIGSVQWVQAGRIIASSNVIAAEDAPAPSWWQRIGTFFGRLWARATGGQTVAAGSVTLPDVEVSVPDAA